MFFNSISDGSSLAILISVSQAYQILGINLKHTFSDQHSLYNHFNKKLNNHYLFSLIQSTFRTSALQENPSDVLWNRFYKWSSPIFYMEYLYTDLVFLQFDFWEAFYYNHLYMLIEYSSRFRFCDKAAYGCFLPRKLDT